MSKEHKKKKEEVIESEEEIVDANSQTIDEATDEFEELRKKAAENLEGWQRLQAEFENYKKRTAESQKDMIKYATQNIVLEILPVIDNFHASTDHIPEDQKENPWVTGIMYIQKQLENVLTENGVEEIVANVGDNFDPIYHEAIEDKECEDCKNEKYVNKIKKVLTKGYKISDRVIRAARVVVE
ncbi:MAG: nucleotide exchange factor GrpE [bacterium]